MRRKLILLTLLLSTLIGFAASAQDARISIASGVSGGTYRGIYADDLEKQLADYTVIHRLSSGSGENLEMLADGRAAFGFAQADVYAVRMAADPERFGAPDHGGNVPGVVQVLQDADEAWVSLGGDGVDPLPPPGREKRPELVGHLRHRHPGLGLEPGYPLQA